ncbi:MAG TPA: hypothetical protein PLE45_06850 [Spirochaetota bacterium]|nr:hypothetical protein [Spirochaetota bacterium]HOL56767.1 hypothetical protein [Spirochaetota bacterium]HPP04446.1 hypothetical protein [Spirochaetota bacterium]
MKRIVICFLFIFSTYFLNSSSPPLVKNFEKRFQIGFGLNVTTSNMLSFIDNIKMTQVFKNFDSGKTYDDLTPEEKILMSKEQFEHLKNLSANTRTGILVANIFGGMEYAFQLRILWKILMIETDFALVPYNGFYNGRFDFGINANGGIRLPFVVMPYITGGVSLSFHFYPDAVYKIEPWKARWGSYENFAFRLGLNFKAGLDFKFKIFSFGFYYQWAVKDFQEFSDWWGEIVNNLENNGESEQNAQAKAAGMIFGAQSRFGVSICWYIY